MTTKFTVSEYATKIGKSRQWVYKLVNNGVVKTVNHDNKVYIIENPINEGHRQDVDKKTVNKDVNQGLQSDNQGLQSDNQGLQDDNQTKPVAKPNETQNKTLSKIETQNNEIQANTVALVKNDKDLLKEMEMLRQIHSENTEKTAKRHLLQIISITVMFIVGAIVGLVFLLNNFNETRNNDQKQAAEREKAHEKQITAKDDELNKVSGNLKQETNAHHETKTKLAVLENEHKTKLKDFNQVKIEKVELEKEKATLGQQAQQLMSKNEELQKEINKLREALTSSTSSTNIIFE